MISFRHPARFDKAATLILVDKEQAKNRNFPVLPKALKDSVAGVLDADQFPADNGQLFPVINGKQIVLLAGVGKKNDLSTTALRSTVRNALLSSWLKKAGDVEIVVHDPKDDVIKAAIEAALIGTYAWEKYKTPGKNDKAAAKKHIFLAAAPKREYAEAATVCDGVNLARDLINDNADTVTSTYFEKTVRALIKGKKNISLEILNRKEMEKYGLGLHLAVNQGSKKEPKLIIVRYKGAAKDGDYTAIIGKGMTYDTGGLNLKPTGHIETMRQDMSGAAAAVGTLKNAIALNIKKNIIFACVMAENAIDALSYKPGDVIRGYSGKTVEIGNTDAEGRLVLADAFSYIIKNYKPARLIDIATLTGACVVALGHDYTGLVASDDKLARKLTEAAEVTDDRVWRLPIYPELKDSVKSQIADIRNTGFPKGAGGTITAAEFLRQFTEGTPWAHLDIAGTAFVDNKQRLYFGHGATGASVRLLTRYLTHN
ncbi:MAG: leucyl aminopeptidase [Candidatus Omnitrophica bacterium]|nr:leucyl aminopeptidase [Candidatus Omnitrophota bacterium]